MTLKELRHQWEENGAVLLTLTSPAQDVYTLVKGELSQLSSHWHVFKYSKKGDTWDDNSVVASHFPSLEQCLDHLNKEFEEYYPGG